MTSIVSGIASKVVGLGPKISAVMSIVLVCLGIVTAWVIGADAADILRRQFITRGLSLTRAIEVTANEFVAAGRQAALADRLRALSDLEAVRYFVVLDVRGAPIASSFPDLVPSPLVQALIRTADSGVPQGDDSEVMVSEFRIPDFDVIDISSPVDAGTLHVGLDVTPIGRQTRNTVMRVVVIFIVFILIGAAIAILAGQLLVRPLYTLMRVSNEVSAGNLRVQANVETRDEFSIFGASLNGMVGSLRKIVGGVRSATTRVSEAAADIVMSSKAQESGVSEQTASIDEVTHSMEALTSTAHAIAGRSQDLAGLGQRMSDQLRGATEAVEAARSAMREISDRNDMVSARVQELYEHSRAIISVIDIIESISDRLDLLALNAALEGARAGDVGKGFSLVAQEMRRLAESVMSSTREVKETIAIIGDATRASLTASRDSSEATKHGVSEMETMVSATKEMFELVERAVGSARQIFEITQQQLSSSEQVSSAMGEITAVSTSATALAQEVTRAANQMADIASLLEAEVSTFRVDNDEA
ncbi:MAG: methyl-accepting chemotaxis protein [Myxococcota bacterium]